MGPKSDFSTANSRLLLLLKFLRLHPIDIKKKGFVFAKVGLKSNFLIANSRSPLFPISSKFYPINIMKNGPILSKVCPKFDLSNPYKDGRKVE